MKNYTNITIIYHHDGNHTVYQSTKLDNLFDALTAAAVVKKRVADAHDIYIEADDELFKADLKELKVVKLKKIKATVETGTGNPNYKKVVEGFTDGIGCGYYGGIELVVPRVHWEEDPEGILVYKKGKFVGTKPSAAFDGLYIYWVDKVVA